MTPPRQIENATSPGRTPVIFGEVLFDCFPDGRQVLGGAPFNVAWNLRGLGLDPFFVSAVGDDDLGQRVRESMRNWGMDLSGLTTLSEYPTGVVSVSLSDGQPSYEIKTGQAYDHAPVPEWETLGDRPGLLYHGSLVFRSEASRDSLRQLISQSKLPRFVDINIRRPHFDESWVPELLTGATWVKINDDELEQLAGVQLQGSDSIRSAVDQMQRNYGEATYLITCGGEGAYVVADNRIDHVPAPEPETMNDTVGAGDSFAAAVIAGLLVNKPLPEAMRGAVKLASRVCGLNGATTTDTTNYEGILEVG